MECDGTFLQCLIEFTLIIIATGLGIGLAFATWFLVAWVSWSLAKSVYKRLTGKTLSLW